MSLIILQHSFAMATAQSDTFTRATAQSDTFTAGASFFPFKKNFSFLLFISLCHLQVVVQKQLFSTSTIRRSRGLVGDVAQTKKTVLQPHSHAATAFQQRGPRHWAAFVAREGEPPELDDLIEKIRDTVARATPLAVNNAWYMRELYLSEIWLSELPPEPGVDTATLAALAIENLHAEFLAALGEMRSSMTDTKKQEWWIAISNLAHCTKILFPDDPPVNVRAFTLNIFHSLSFLGFRPLSRDDHSGACTRW